MGSLIAGECLAGILEAVAFSNDENESLEAKARKALECPCLDDLRNGPCGFSFSEAFLCYLKSIAHEKGSDCVHPFVALQNCIKENPNAFDDDILESDEEEVKKEEPAAAIEAAAIEEYDILPPKWAKEKTISKTNP